METTSGQRLAQNGVTVFRPLVTFLAIFTFLLTACGGGSGGGSTPSSSSTSSGSSSGSADTTRPTVTITTPTSGAAYTATSNTLSLGGAASDNVGVTQVTWSNSLGGSGTASGTASWSASGITLQNGTNTITVTARDAAGNTGTGVLSVTYSSGGSGDTTAPTVTITSPTSGSTYTAPSSTLSLSGTASDNVGVTQVTWSNSLGGSGTASGSSSWSISGISLQTGTNLITVTARDAAGNSRSASISVAYNTTSGTTYYVATTGDDSNNDGSLNSPFKTISHAVSVVNPGGTIEIRGGTYTESITINRPGTSNNWITMRPYNNEQVAVKSTGSGPTIYFYHNNCDETVVNSSADPSGNTNCQPFYWTIQGLEIQGSPNGGGDGNAVKIDAPEVKLIGNKLCCTVADVVKLVRTSNHVEILNNEIWQNSTIVTPSTNAQGVDIVGADDVRVANNYVHNVNDIGIYTKGNARRNVFENNRLENIGLTSGANALMLGQSTDTIRLLDGNYETYDSIMRNNIVVNTGGPCLATASSYNVHIYNNSCYNTGQRMHGSILISNESDLGWSGLNIEIKNNIIYGSANNPIIKISNYMGPALSDNKTLHVDHNIYWINGGAVKFSWDGQFDNADFSTWKTQYKILTGNDDTSLVVDPKYANTADLTLSAGSPAIDAGVDVNFVTTDYNGAPRPFGAHTDIGAYEYGSTP